MQWVDRQAAYPGAIAANPAAELDQPKTWSRACCGPTRMGPVMPIKWGFAAAGPWTNPIERGKSGTACTRLGKQASGVLLPRWSRWLDRGRSNPMLSSRRWRPYENALANCHARRASSFYGSSNPGGAPWPTSSYRSDRRRGWSGWRSSDAYARWASGLPLVYRSVRCQSLILPLV